MKKQQNRRAAALALTAVLLLGGCAQQTAAPAASSAASEPSSTASSTASAASLAGEQTEAEIDTGALLDPKKPVIVTVWNYYNGNSQATFEELVSEFNATVGAQKGVTVQTVSQGSVDGVSEALLDAVNGRAGAQDVPDLVSVYAETAYILYEKGLLVSYDPYFSQQELDEYVPAFIEEGRLGDGQLYNFPITKSTEIFMANTTDWAAFEQACGVSLDDVQTMEDMAAAAELYYQWTDGQTPDVPEDGLALYGRDAMGNYLILGSYQLGHEIFHVEGDEVTVDLDREAFKTLWDDYYIPFINGYFGAYAKFRSEDCKTGRILSMTCASSGANYFPTTVYLEDDSSHDVESIVRQPLTFANAQRSAVVQQGAGYCLLQSDPQRQAGAVEFLKWFTEEQQNVAFSASVGYSPVKTAANDPQLLTAASEQGSELTRETLLVSAEMFNTTQSYAGKPFGGAKEAREILEKSFEEVCTADRQSVQLRMQEGLTRAEAVEAFASEEYFDAWFDQLRQKVEAAVSAG